MSSESELHELIDIGRRILHERCEQRLCNEWRLRAYELLCELLGSQHEYARLFQGDECCDIKNLFVRANVLMCVKDLVERRKLSLERKNGP
jgi:hypothetical protein